LQKLAGPKVETPHGATIIAWQEYVSGTLEQSGYSLEILDSVNKRVHATGRINSDNIGDFFITTTNIPSQTMTAKIRLWLKYGNIALTESFEVSGTFEYTAYPPPINNPTTTTVKQIAWIPDWGMSSGIASIRRNPKKWETISPVWFTPNKNGMLIKESTTNSPTLIKLLRENNIKLVPTISLFDADILTEILNKNLDKHVAEIVAVVEKNGYAGIDLDYESTYEADQLRLLEFITKLAEQLHKKSKTLSFTVLPKIDDRRIYSFLPQTHQAQDWQAIGAIVDEFRIMAYDFTGQGSLQPGPLSPYQWNESLIKYALSNMPAQKIVLALPLYSHGWPKPKTSNLAGVNNDLSLSSGKQKNTISLQHSDIDYIKGHSSYYRETYDTWNKEVRAEFKYNGVERVMYYLNKKSIDERIDLAERYGIKGICYWRIGGDYL
jgi:spore germination protein YaaH